MGLIDRKKDVFTTIGAYTSMMDAGNLPNTTNLFPSINNKKDIVPYLLDILKVVVGTDALQQLAGKIFTNFITKVEPDLKTGLKKQSNQSNSGDNLPTWFNDGIVVPVKNIDIYGKLKTDPNSEQGSLLYNNITNNFDSVARQAILINGTPATFGNLNITYISTTDSFRFQPNIALNTNVSINTFTNEFIDNMELINKKEFMSNVMNLFYGSISSNQDKSVEEIAQELAAMKLVEQLINDNDDFIILPEDYETIQKKSQELANGVTYYDLGCGVMEVYFPLSGMSNLISNISGSTDPFYVGNQINNTINQSTTGNTDTTNENRETIKDNFFQKLINLITQTLAQAITSTPQIRTLLAIISSFSNFGVPQIGNPLDDMKKFRTFLKCNINVIMALINKFIFDLIVTSLIALINPIIRRITRERINQYTKQIKSLTASKII